MPATRSNRLGLALVLVGGALGCATAQHQGQLDGAAAAMLSAMIVALYGVALKVMGRTTDAADHVMIRASLDRGAATMLIAGSHWTENEVIPALEAQTGRWLGDRYFVLAGKALRGGRTLRGLGVREGSELEVRHRRHGGMGCAGSKAVNTSDVTLEYKKPEFESTTPMLVMPFEQFKAQGRICKSTKAWREEAFEKKWLVEYDASSGKVVIFISHTCAAPSLRHRKPAPSPAPLSILRPPCSLSRPYSCAPAITQT